MKKLSWQSWASVGAGLLVACGVDDSRGGDLPTGSGIGEVSASDTDATGETGDDPSGADAGDCAGHWDCGDGEICVDGACVPGCAGDDDCEGGSCCDGTCADLSADAEHCGACGEPCSADDMECIEGVCQMPGCPEGRNDCNGDASDGCETEGECACAPGETQDCYSGEADTLDIGECRAGTQMCNEFGTAWGSCDNEVIPDAEVCSNGLDDNCDGVADEDPDEDGDGWTVCGGDCCDTAGADCGDPDLVNPGAFEVDANEVDDDCDGMVDNPLPACDMGLSSNTNDAFDYARAVDLCQFTEEDPGDPADRIWGVIEASLTRANGAGSPDSNSRSLRDNFGDNISTQFGDRLVVLSTGHAADNDDDTNPNYRDFQTGQDMDVLSALPADWLAANGGDIPNPPSCPDPLNNVAYDPVMLNVRVRAPTNANSFTLQMYFFSAEYPEWVCTEYNDFFVALVDSADPGNPADGNIAIYDDGGTTWPVGVNLVSAAAGLFSECANGSIAQCGGGGTYNGCTGTSELNGTGFDIVENPFGCPPNARTGGGTGWLTMSGNVEPGEIVDLRFAIWDVSDPNYDSLVLLDAFAWDVEESTPGVTPS